MAWSIVYLVFAIGALAVSIWNLALAKNFFLSLLGILWFLIVLFLFFIPDVYNVVLIKGVPPLGTLIKYLGLPVILILAFFQHRIKRQ